MSMKSRWLRGTVALVAAAGMAAAAGVRVNWTPSLPVGLYAKREAPEGATPRRGVIVEACLPSGAAAFALKRGYVGPGPCPSGTMPLLKPAAAVHGDTVDIAEDGVRVNGTLVAGPGLEQDSQGRPLPPLVPGTYAVVPGTVWILSDHDPRSFDSRYFGPVPVESVRASARPLLTFGGG